MCFSIIIPVFNEEKSVRSIVDQVRTIYPHAEIIIVDDGSVDGTASRLEGLPIDVIRHQRNRGYGAAIKTGILAAKFPIIATIDADGEHFPEDIDKLIKTMDSVEMVVGSRPKCIRGPGILKIVGRIIFNEVVSFLSSSRIPDINSGLRVFKKDALLRFFHLFPDTFSFHTTSTLAILFSGGRIRYVPIEVSFRIGQSKVRLRDGVISLLYVINLALRMDSCRAVVGGMLIVSAPALVIWKGFFLGGSILLIWGLLLEKLSRNHKITGRICWEDVCG